jgi:hypothetical protein
LDSHVCATRTIDEPYCDALLMQVNQLWYAGQLGIGSVVYLYYLEERVVSGTCLTAPITSESHVGQPSEGLHGATSVPSRIVTSSR